VAGVAPGTGAPAGAERLGGLVLPGLVNAHSHAFQRALRGRTQAGRGSFWTWREQMYALAARLDPDRARALGRAAFAEMALAGFTTVGEFHYVHHDAGGRPYAEENAMGAALVEAARDAGLRICLLDACYLTGGIGVPLDGVARRFGDGDANRWAERAEALHATYAGADDVVVGAAVHSVRAVPREQVPTVAAWAEGHGVPLHAHVSEQRAENVACGKAYRLTPTRVLADAGALGPLTTAVHATHLTAGDIACLGDAHTHVCLCPTTERDLADGVGPAARLRDAGAPLTLGTDSHAVVDAFAEARGVEHHLRLVTGRRGHLRPAALLAALTADGQASVGFADAGRIEAGARADLVAVRLDSVRTAGADPATAADMVVFAGAAADVTDVVVDGRRVVRDGVHALGDVGRLLADAVADVQRDDAP
ncbi:MAG TPA: formimidoylglutamate deiminase, partial [Egibacteraceae bacterium]|nr:formimidoylglutamate deiminase [Egibacteraceae bacterium]